MTTYNHKELLAADRKTLIHPYLPASREDRVIMTEGKGCTLIDTEGKDYLDATGGLWLAQIGHGNEEVARVAYEQMQTLEYFTSFWEFSNVPSIKLAERLVSLAPDNIQHVYFTSGGSEGNEAAIKMARYYFHRRGEPNRTWILSRQNAYHGVAFGGGTATGFPVFHTGFGPLLPQVSHLSTPWPYRTELYDGMDPTDFLINELEARIAEIGAENIAMMLAEPIMGVGGMLVPPADYWSRVREVLTRHGILLVFDEVVTAYGRTGHWFAAQYYDIQPDIIITAKGITSGYIPLGAVLVSADIGAVLQDDFGFPMGYTYSGHPTACAVALANLDIIEREQLLPAAVKMGAFMAQKLTEAVGDLPIVGEIRQLGMMFAIELVSDRQTRKPLAMLQSSIPDIIRREHGVIVRDCGHMLVMSPPLILTEDEALSIVESLREVLVRTGTDGVVKSRQREAALA